MLLVLGQGPCPKSLKLYTKLKPGSGTAVSDFLKLLLVSFPNGKKNVNVILINLLLQFLVLPIIIYKNLRELCHSLA